MSESADGHIEAFRRHPRDWRDNLYVYPVISRRSRGLSIGVNLNPDMACNFDCIYCQVDRSQPARARGVELPRLREELADMLARAADGSIFDDAQFGYVPDALRRVNDIAFSGDGEPTTCPVFVEAVELAAAAARDCGIDGIRIVLITDACYLTRPQVEKGLRIMDEACGEVWAKLDAGTQAYYELINRPNYALSHVIENITAAARVRPVTIQSLFMRVDGLGPNESEIGAYADRLSGITKAGGLIREVQVYTVARKPAEANVSPLDDAELDAIAQRVRLATGLSVTAFH